MKYITEYQPNLTKTCKTYIENNITPSFNAEETNVYNLDYVCEVLKSKMNEGNEEVIFKLLSKDMEVLQSLVNEKVDYIEF